MPKKMAIRRIILHFFASFPFTEATKTSILEHVVYR
jgi:hypothetical protein